MKNALLLLAGATALSLASCSQEKTTDTTTTTAPAEGAMTTTTVSDATYKTRGTRMADKFATDMKISDDATKEKLRTAYYNRSKRYDEMADKYKTDTTGYYAARAAYNAATDAEFQTILVAPAQYSAYQSSRATYDESSNLNNLDNTQQGASSATMPNADSSTMSSSTMTTTPTANNMGGGAMVEKGKTKLSDGTKIKVKDDGTVKVKDADGNKVKM